MYPKMVQLEMLTSVTTKMLHITRQQILTKLFMMIKVILGIKLFLKKERFEVDLYFFFAMIRRIGIIKAFSAQTYKPKPLGFICDAQHVFRLRGVLGLDEKVIKQAKAIAGKVFSQIYFVNTLRGSLVHTNTILAKINLA